MSVHPPSSEALDDPLGGSAGRFDLALVLLAHALLFVLLNGNFDHDFDAQQYGRIAHEIADGNYVPSPHPFSQRFGVTVPAALLFRLFGQNWFAATFWPLLCSLGTIAGVHVAVRRTVGRRAALVAAVLLASNLIQVRFSTRLLPDVVVSCFLLVAAVLVERGRAGPPERQVRMGLLAALALLAALLSKVTVVWAGPFYMALLLYDLVRGRNWRLWVAFLLGVTACGLAFFGTYELLAGDPLYRLRGIEGVHNARAGFFAGGLAQYARRLTYEPLLFLYERPGFGLALLLALPALVMAARAPRAETASARYWSAYLISVMGSFWFGTTSLRVYTPLYLADRFLMPFLAPLAILGSITIARAFDGSRRSRLELAPFLLGALAAAAWIAQESGSRASFYLALGLLGAVAARDSRVRPRAMAALLVLTMALPLIEYGLRRDARETPLLIQLERDLVRRTFPLEGPPVAVFTDPHSVFVLPYYLPRTARERVRFVSWDDPLAAPRAGERVLVYIHQPRLLAVNLNWGQRVPPFARVQPETWRRLQEHSLDGQHWLLLLEADDPASVLVR